MFAVHREHSDVIVPGIRYHLTEDQQLAIRRPGVGNQEVCARLQTLDLTRAVSRFYVQIQDRPVAVGSKHDMLTIVGPEREGVHRRVEKDSLATG